jgi:hypothetical protein
MKHSKVTLLARYARALINNDLSGLNAEDASELARLREYTTGLGDAVSCSAEYFGRCAAMNIQGMVADFDFLAVEQGGTEPSKEKLLAQLKTLIAGGLTFADCCKAFSSMEPADIDAHKAAAEDYSTTELEVDSNVITSCSSENDGRWVMSWVWVYNGVDLQTDHYMSDQRVNARSQQERYD